MNKAYFLWIPLSLAFNVVMCWAAVKYNGVSFIKGYLIMVAGCFIPTWAIASYYSKNLIFDNMLYSLLMIVSSPVIMIYFGQGKTFTFVNYIGVAVTILGLYLIKK